MIGALISPADVAERILYPALEEVEPMLEVEVPRERSSPLMGNGSPMDSLALVTYLVAVEARLESQTDRPIRLVNENAMSRGASPFRTLGTLADYIAELTSES